MCDFTCNCLINIIIAHLCLPNLRICMSFILPIHYHLLIPLVTFLNIHKWFHWRYIEKHKTWGLYISNWILFVRLARTFLLACWVHMIISYFCFNSFASSSAASVSGTWLEITISTAFDIFIRPLAYHTWSLSFVLTNRQQLHKMSSSAAFKAELLSDDAL